MELQSLIEMELDALAKVSQANRTLIQAAQVVKDARAARQPMLRTYSAASARGVSKTKFSVSRSSFGS